MNGDTNDRRDESPGTARRIDRLGALVTLCLVSLTASALGADAKKKLTYEDDVLPVFRARCANCHNMDKAKADLNVMSYQGITQGSSSGEVLSPGDPGASKLYQVMAHQAEPKMPPSGKVPDAELEVVRRWIEGGLIEKSGAQAKASKKPKVDLSLAAAPTGKPSEPIPLPAGLLLEPVLHTAKSGAIPALAANPWAPMIAVAGPGQVVLYQSDSLDILGVLPFPEGQANVLKFSRGGRLLLAGGGLAGKLGKVIVWDIATGQRTAEVGEEFDAVLAADISADQSFIALGGPGKLVKVYSTKTGEIVHTIKKHTDWVTSIEFSPDCVLLASGDRAGNLVVWETLTGREFYSLLGHKAQITDLAWRDDSNALASGSEDGTIRVWEMFNGTQVAAWNAHGGVLSVRFAHDGRLVSCGRDRATVLWEVSGKAVRSFEATSDLALRAAISHDGARIFTGDWMGEVRAYAAADGKRLGTITANPPTLAERIQSEQAFLAAAPAKVAAATTAASTASAAAKSAADLLAAAQKSADPLLARQKASEAEATARVKSQAALKALVDKLRADQAAKEKLANEVAAKAAQATAAVAAATGKLKVALADSAARAADAKNRTEVLAAVLSTSQSADAKVLEAKTAVEKATQAAFSAVDSARRAQTEVQSTATAEAKAKADASQAANEVQAARKALADAEASLKRLDADTAAAQTALNTAKSAADAATKALAARAAEAKTAASAADKAKVDLESLQKDIADARARLSRWTVGLARANLAKAQEELAEIEARRDQLAASVKAGQEASAKAKAELAAAVELRAGGPARLKDLEQALINARSVVASATGTAGFANSYATQKEAFVKDFAPVVEKIKQQAAASAGNATLAEAAASAQKTLDHLAADAKAARVIASAQSKTLADATARGATLEQQVARLRAEIESKTKSVPALEQTVKGLAEKLVADQKALADLAAPIAAAKAKVAELSATATKLASAK